MDNTNKSIIRSPFGISTGPFDYGSGHINPVGVLNPGVFYDYNVEDVINFLSSNRPTLAQLRNLTGDNSTCMSKPTACIQLQLSLHWNEKPEWKFNSLPNSHERCNISFSLHGVLVQVLPNQLYFKTFGDKMSFTVKFTVTVTASQFVFGSLTWSNAKYNVYTPIAVNPTSL
ncbi:hypothetical protein SUGI_1178340 [Cryptomeria japonica]|nr:hypothetical protein SUGI_1178340 [Cryptomeria japonica]